MPETRSGNSTTDYDVGQDNVQVFGMDLHHPVFAASAALIVAFVTVAIIYPARAHARLDALKDWVLATFDWLFMVSGNVFLIFCLFLVLHPASKIRLGGEEARPRFSTLSWFSMLFAAGMGIGLMFWSVAEPVAYYTGWSGTPLGVPPETPQAADLAMAATLYHWGFHPWAIYALVGLSLAFFAFNREMPLTLRSAFHPLFGDRIWGRTGDLIDIVAVLATIFGLATSLGLGATQAASGLHFLFDIPNTVNTQIAIIVGVTSVAILSVVRGLHGGVRILSNINMSLAAGLLIFVFAVGPTWGITSAVVANIGDYLSNAIRLSNWIGRGDQAWFHEWTIFYWAWWISWSPFVGMFIARVSRGRTVREFIVAVLLVPPALTVLWISTFGSTAIGQVEQGVGSLSGGIGDISLATFQMLAELPLTSVSSFIGVVLVLVFFVTSSDSGSLVIDSITAGGKLEAPVAQRVFWAALEGVVAGTLLIGGGAVALNALQAGVITTGLPFAVILLLMCVSLYLGLRHELQRIRATSATADAATPA